MSGDHCPSLETLEAMAAGAGGADAQTHVAGCPSCAERLATIRADNALFAEVVAASDTLAAPAAGTTAPRGYRLEGELHRGAQGVVYRAVQEATRRPVAIKYIREGTLATTKQRLRFEREAELVAQLRHPNIVTVHDSGIDDAGQPYLVLELVDGVPITDFVRRGDHAPAVDGVLELFVDVCAAVSAAHRKGIIHRDLKPANILVDDAGAPRVLDFGLARAVEPTAETTPTIEGEFVGTFAYAAPEQVGGDPAAIDTRVDVYALGILLYELLAGTRPYRLDGSLKQVIETITESDPEPISAHCPEIDRDVETIVEKALAKDPMDRYRSVAALADDVRHVLGGEPIVARRHDRWYVLRKTLWRYRLPVTVASLLFVTAIVVAISMGVLYRQATEARRGLAGTLGAALELLGAIDQENPEAPVAVSDLPQLLERASGIIESDLADLPGVAARVHMSLGLAYMSLARYVESERHMQRARALAEDTYRPPDKVIADALHNLGRLRWKTIRFDDAIALYEEALQMRVALYGDVHPDVARTIHHIASTRRRQGRLDEAEQGYLQALAMRQAIYGPAHPAVANTLNGYASCLLDQDRPGEAAQRAAEAVDLVIDHYGADDWRTARALHNLAAAELELGQHDDAQAHLDRSIAIKRRMRGETHPDVINGLLARGRLALARGDGAAAERWARDVLAARRERFGEIPHPDVAEAYALLGAALRAQGGQDAAREAIDAAVEMYEETLGPEHWRTIEARAM